jgi:hypothetical protein
MYRHMVGLVAVVFIGAILLLLLFACCGVWRDSLPDPPGPLQLLDWVMEKEVSRRLFHCKGVIPFLIGLAVAMLAFGETELFSPYLVAHLLFLTAMFWSIEAESGVIAKVIIKL